MKTKNRWKFGICTLLIIVLFYVLMVGVNVKNWNYKVNSLPSLINLGLDLKGGVSLEMKIADGPTDDETLSRTKQLLELRVNSMGVSEATVTVNKTTNRFRVEIPGVYDTQEALETLGQTGELTFVGPDDKIILTGDDVKEASVGADSSNQPVVALKLKADGATKFAEATEKFYGQIITIKMDDDEVSAPQVNAVITNGEAIITVGGDLEEAKRLANIIQSGALPVKLESASEKLTGATLGAKAIPTSVKASIIGIAGVMLFMLLYYKASGLVADFALAIYIVLTFGVYVLIGQVLSLPGIAGFLLSVGMAVDANVLIFERIKEELKIGKSLTSAIDSGFHRALSSILDSNITTIIAGLVLYYLGSITVKGFALTLTIGVICSMFTAVTVTRFLLKSLVGTGWIKNAKWFLPIVAGSKEKTFKIIENKAKWFAVSAAIIIIGVSFLFVKGMNYGIDFKGGAVMTVETGQTLSEDDIDDVRSMAAKYDKDATARTINNTGVEISSSKLSLDELDKVFNELKGKYSLKDDAREINRNDATIGKEQQRSAIIASLAAIACILVYVGIRFEFKMGIAAVIALVHDLLVMVTVYSVFQIPLQSSFVAAMLTILGYSINDTIVVFDRIRENRKTGKYKDYTSLANASITQTMSRSINTSFTTLITIVVIYILGVSAIKEFAFPLIIGIVSGTYSSIFIASPLWVMFEKDNKLA